MSPGIRHLVMASLYFSIMSLLVKTAGRTLPAMEIDMGRGVVTLVLSFLQLRAAGLSPWGTHRGLLALRGALGSVGLMCFYYSVTELPLAEATVIQYMNPVITALIAVVLLDERARLSEVGAAAVCLVGVLLVARPAALFGEATAGYPPLALAAAFTGAVTSSFAYVSVRMLGTREDARVIVFWFPLVAVPATIPLLIPVAVWPTPMEVLLLLGVGTMTHLAQLNMTRGLQMERAGRAASVGYLQVVFAAAWGALLFGEIPDALAVAGMVLVVGGTLLVGRGPRPRPGTPSHAAPEEGDDAPLASATRA